MSNSETPQNGATPRWINFTESPWPPDWARDLLTKQDTSPHIFTLLHDEGFCEALTWGLALAPTPAQLEAGYHFILWMFALYQIGDVDLLNEVYQGRWNYLTGGHGG
ncbi:hypothetical protein [Micromonospora sp. NPDC093244]|uniref:hypothetical protein n=1 Tax=Micromonospora sp. NPDC093244 TaxID=3155071 RepID=UPI003420BB56